MVSVQIQTPCRLFPREFLSLYLTYHVKTRSLKDVVSLICGTLSDLTLQGRSPNFYKQISLSCLSDRGYADEMSAAIARYLTPSQVAATASTMTKALGDTWSTFNTLLSSLRLEHVPHTPKAKKRRVSNKGQDSMQVDQNSPTELLSAAARFVATTNFARVILLSLPLHTVSKEVISNIANDARQLRETALLPAIANVLDESPADGDERVGQRESQLVGAAALRLVYGLQGAVFWRFDPSPQAKLDEAGERAEHLLRSRNTLPELRVELVSLEISLEIFSGQ